MFCTLDKQCKQKKKKRTQQKKHGNSATIGRNQNRSIVDNRPISELALGTEHGHYFAQDAILQVSGRTRGREIIQAKKTTFAERRWRAIFKSRRSASRRELAEVSEA
jgi:hypothetical protein